MAVRWPAKRGELPDKLTNIIEDTSPQLGADLDLNGFDITGTGNISIAGNVTLATTQPQLFMQETGLGDDLGNWGMQVTASQWQLFTATDDAPTSPVSTVIKITRTTTAADLIQLNAVQTRTLGDLKVDGQLIGNNTLQIGANTQIQDGKYLRFLDDDGSAYMEAIHDGLDMNFNMSSTADLDITGLSGVIRVPDGSGMGLDAVSAKNFTMKRVTLADDATAAVALGASNCFIIIQTTYNRTTCLAAFTTSQQSWDTIAVQGSLVSLGASSNPDVDGRMNYWKSASSTLSIKNRIGSTRSFTIFIYTV